MISPRKAQKSVRKTVRTEPIFTKSPKIKNSLKPKF